MITARGWVPHRIPQKRLVQAILDDESVPGSNRRPPACKAGRTRRPPRLIPFIHAASLRHRLPRQYGRIRADTGGFGHWSRFVPKRAARSRARPRSPFLRPLPHELRRPQLAWIRAPLGSRPGFAIGCRSGGRLPASRLWASGDIAVRSSTSALLTSPLIIRRWSRRPRGPPPGDQEPWQSLRYRRSATGDASLPSAVRGARRERLTAADAREART